MVTLIEQLVDIGRQLARPSGRAAWRTDLEVLPRALRWALPWAILGRVSRHASPCRWLHQHAQQRPTDLALADPSTRLTFAELRDACSTTAAVLAANGVGRGSRVAISLPTNHRLVEALLACWWIGAVPCPIDPEAPILLESEILVRLEPDFWIVDSPRMAHPGVVGSRQICLDPMTQGSAQIRATRPIASPFCASELALILATSGSEGQVKLCRITAGRLALSGHAFGGLALRCRRGDVIFCPLPLWHATAVTVALMPALVHGVALHLTERFSASRFWEQLGSSRATQLVYVGDLLRYALSTLPPSGPPSHSLRVAVGNGLDRDTWATLRARLAFPTIIEFYGATEAPSALLNFSGKCGSIGRVPLRRLSRYLLVDTAREDAQATGKWRICAANEPGELWIRLPSRARPWLGDFEGYLETHGPGRSVVENAFRSGDRYFRTFDVMRFDADDYFYYVDRLGEIWRSKGHNVSTRWLADELRQIDGVEDACVVPIALDDTPRRFGLAVVVLRQGAAVTALEAKLGTLPGYARPQLVEIAEDLPRGSSFKLQKSAWLRGPWEPTAAAGTCYVWRHGLVRLNAKQWPEVRAALQAS